MTEYVNSSFQLSEVMDQSLSDHPSGYSLTRIVLTAVVVTIIMVVVVVGNALVIIAIVRDNTLKGLQYWFIGSLAVADLMIGSIIMPFSLARELMGYWAFGPLWCSLHAAIDVLACTSSINNICLISLDRYWSITQAVEYLQTRTSRRVALMIGAVWLFSALISIPPLLGWRQSPPQTNLPMCQLSDDIGYVLYSALGSFYIPSIIMIFVYIRIYFAARKRARRHVPRKAPKANDAPAVRIGNNADTKGEHRRRSPSDQQEHQTTTFVAADVNQSSESGVVPRISSDTSNYRIDTINRSTEYDTAVDSVEFVDRKIAPEQDEVSNADEGESSSIESTVQSKSKSRNKKGSAQRSFNKFFRKKMQRTNSTLSSMVSHEQQVNTTARTVFTQEKEKRRLARKKEKRATLILGLIMGSFIACWLPFFILYVLTAFCTTCYVADWGFGVAFWLGYFNSALNPVIYTIFNKDFRKAFRRILCKGFRRH